MLLLLPFNIGGVFTEQCWFCFIIPLIIQCWTLQAVQQDRAPRAADGRGGDRHQRDPGRHQQHSGNRGNAQIQQHK